MAENKKKTGKVRKVSSGPIREKARTMNKIITAVGTVIKDLGYPGLTIANISKVSGTDRKLIYTYFGTLDHLVETYIKQKDYWCSEVQKNTEDLIKNNEKIDLNFITTILQRQFDAVLNDQERQKIIHWELGENKDMLRRLSDSREELGERLFQLCESQFEGTDIDLRATVALLIGGLYYLALHANSNGSLFCGIDINEPQGKERIDRTMEKILQTCYERTEK